MAKRKRLLTEFAVQVLEDGSIKWDGLDRFLWEFLHGGAVKTLAILSNEPRWRRQAKNI
jgi:hypothetical protein